MVQHLWHGGCHRCTQQEINEVDFCVGCCYFLPAWNLSNLNNEPKNEEMKTLKEQLIKKYHLTTY